MEVPIAVENLLCDALKLSEFSYNDEVTIEVIAVFQSIADRSTVFSHSNRLPISTEEISYRVNLKPSHVELIQYLLCSNDLAEYGGSPRCCWITEKGRNLLDNIRNLMATERNGNKQMNIKRKSYFYVETTYQNAVNNTDKGLIPIAAKLKLLEDREDYIPDHYYLDEFIGLDDTPPMICLAMTTVFSDPKYNGNWGHANIEQETRQKIGEVICQTNFHSGWHFFSQKWVDTDSQREETGR